MMRQLVDSIAEAGMLYVSLGIEDEGIKNLLRLTAEGMIDSPDDKYYELCDILVALRRMENN
jgi:hypothetical protein